MAYDVAVIGLGAMGGAALLNLARRGVRVVGIEQFEPGHDRGSSHGETRIIRIGYFEHPSYVPLLRRTYELWRELEAECGRPLVHITGIAEIGPPDGEVVAGTLRASREHGLPHEVLDAKEVMRRFPAFRIPDHYAGVVQPDGGFLDVEPSVEAMIALAKAAGAQVRTGETVRAIKPTANSVQIETDRGTVDAGTAIVAAGAWVSKLLPGSAGEAARHAAGAGVVRAERRIRVRGRAASRCSCSKAGTACTTAFRRRAAQAVKIAKHHHADETVDPDTVNRAISATDETLIRAAIADHIPAANGRMIAAKTCLYTVTPDHDFIIDTLPGAANVIVASPCSGHGFKFAPVVGEILGDLATERATRHDISRFRLGRFGG